MLIDSLRSRGPLGRRRKKHDTGFTLIELLVVVTILGILAAVTVIAVSGIGDKGKAAAAGTDSSILRTAEEAACANQSMGFYEDSPQLLRDGLLAAIGGYNDVDLNPINGGGTCTGTAPNTGSINPNANLSLNPANVNTHYAVFTPTTTSYPIYVTSCYTNTTVAGTPPTTPLQGVPALPGTTSSNVIATGLAAAPKRVLVGDYVAYETMLDMGLGSVAYYSDSAGSVQADLINQLPTNLQSAATADMLGSSGTGGPNLLPPDSNAPTTPITPATVDPSFLKTNGIDFVYTILPSALETGVTTGANSFSGSSAVSNQGIITGTAANGAVDTDPAGVIGVPAYMGFNGGILPSAGGYANSPCYNAPKDNSGNLLPAGTLEPAFHELRTLGTIFNAQNTAMQAIAPFKTAIGADLVEAKAHDGTSTPLVLALDQGTLTGFGGQPAYTSLVDVYDGVTGQNAVISSAGGNNVLGSLLPGSSAETTAGGLSLGDVASQYKPQILVLMTLDGTGSSGSTCQSMVTAAKTAFGNLPYVCDTNQNFDGTRPRSQAGVQEIANLIQALPS
jgi:prepilin-type N-terminal cleavage/methylation domain-containing protein